MSTCFDIDGHFKDSIGLLRKEKKWSNGRTLSKMKNNESINASGGFFFTMAPLTRAAHVASLYIISLLCTF